MAQVIKPPKLSDKAKAKLQAKKAQIDSPLNISDQLVVRMMKSPVFRERFQFIQAAALEFERQLAMGKAKKAPTLAAKVAPKKKKKGCGCGGGAKAFVVPTDLLNHVRQKIGKMTIKDKATFKTLLQAKQVVVKMMDENNNPIRLKF